MATVNVGCKLPNGIRAELNGKTVVLAGANSARLVGGFGITEGVDKEFMDGWMKAEAKNPLVSKGLVFVVDHAAKVAGAAAERAGEKSGLEALDPEKPAAGVVKTESED